MFKKNTDRQNVKERQERRLGGRFSVFFVVLMKRVFSVVVLAVVLFSVIAWGCPADRRAAGGICGKNNGEIVNFYSDAENSKDLYDLLVKEQGIGGWMGGIAKDSWLPDSGLKSEELFPNMLDQVLQRKEKERQIVREALKQEEISMLIWEVILAKGEDWKSLEMEAEVLEDRVSLQLSDSMETVAINIFPAQTEQKQEDLILVDGNKWEEFKVLWKQCGTILYKEGIEDYERFSWHMTDAARRESETLGKFILYQTAEGKQGFFRQSGEVLYQVESWGRAEEGGQDEGYPSDIQEMKAQIKKLSVTEEDDEEPDEWKEPESGLYATMLWKLWDGHMPAWGVGWDSTVMRDAAYRSLYAQEEVPAWEEIGEMEQLSVSVGENDRLETFSDLEKIPHLKELRLYGADQAQIDFGLTKEMIPELEELTISCIGLDNLSFLEGFPQLKILSVLDCGLEDISGIECQRELREIKFSKNVISDISPIKNCKKVEILTLAYSGIKDISVLASLPELSEVRIYRNEISDIAPLQYLAKLRKVDFHSNQVTDLSPLRNMTELTSLAASYNQISDISPLEGMTKLYSLDLDYNEIQDIRVIENMPMLWNLSLYHNQILDFSPALELTQLCSFSMGENPGQNHIGDLVFLPRLVIENSFSENGEIQQEAQETLDRFYPDKELTAQDLVKGDLNGDGIVDLAITGLGEEEHAWHDDGRKIYPFLGQADGSLQALSPVDTFGPDSGGVYGDPYKGILITDGRLVVKVYGGSNWRWGYTNIYQYENGEMKGKWELEIEEYTYSPGYEFFITNAEDGSYRWYVIVGEWEGERRRLLLAQFGEESSPVEKEFIGKYVEYQERTGIALPEFNGRAGRPSVDPSVDPGWYVYQIHDQLFDTKRMPGEVLLEAATKYLGEYQEIPVPYYTSKEILENYKALTGVELPEFFLIGQDMAGSGTKILAYRCCRQQEDGSYEHELYQWGISEDKWSLEPYIYYDESDGMFSVGE